MLHPQHMEVPTLGVKSELQLPAYATATATATQDPSCICDLHHSSWKHQIPNPLSEARYRTHNFMNTSQVLNLLSHNGNAWFLILKRPLLCLRAIALTILFAWNSLSPVLCRCASSKCFAEMKGLGVLSQMKGPKM